MDIQELYQIYLQHPVITTDSRQCPADSLFFALKGESFDGNRFAQMALEKGCAYAIVDDASLQGEHLILVKDVLETLQQLAAYHRQQLRIPVLQITGTNGKTTTKELVSAVLSKKFNTLYTQGNLNNHIGVPRTLLRITAEHEIAVIETGANHPGEIEFLCRMVQADYGLITNVGRAHLEGFGSFEGVKKTKGELYDSLASRQKGCFLNMMDMDLFGMWAERSSEGCQLLPYVQGVVLDCKPFVRLAWMHPVTTQRHEVQTQLIGSYNLPNLLAAITVGLHFGVPADDIDAALSEYAPTNNRSEFRQTERNSLIVDAYNANPTSMAAALDNFAMIEAKEKMVILGDMRELGAESQEEHRKIVDKLQQTNVEEVWFVGDNFRQVAPQNARCYSNVDEVKTELTAHPLSGKTILIKGSNGTKLFQLPELL